MKKVMVFITAILFFMPFSSVAATINIPGDQPNIQAAIDAAVDGDIVLLADGTYTGTGNYNVDLNGKSISVKSENGANRCIIDCQQNGRGFLIYHGETITFEGLTIKNCAIGDGKDGGGIYVEYSDMTVINCVFENNSAYSGGAIYIESSSDKILSCINCKFIDNNASQGGAIYSYNYSLSASFANCSFKNNNAVLNGGAIYFYTYSSSSINCRFNNCNFTGNSTSREGGAVYSSSYSLFNGCVFNENRADKGGAVFSTESWYSDCKFNDNVAGIDGGAIYHSAEIVDTLTPNFRNCVFTGNNASDDGGAVFILHYSEFVNCIFIDNIASDCGGSITFIDSADSSIKGCVFYGNNADGGGAIFSTSSSIVFINCTFAFNESFIQGGAIWCYTPLVQIDITSIKNCIMWGDMAPEGDEIYERGKPVVMTYSNIKGGHDGDGNINLDPLFVDAINGDLHLLYGSPCIDSGTVVDDESLTDLDGNLMPVGSAYDMGAYEFQGSEIVIHGPLDQSAWNYASITNPIKGTNPADCKPFAVGDLSSGNVSLQVGLPAFSSGVDVYLAIGFSNALFLIDSSNVLHSAMELTTLPRWKTNNTAAINESLYGDISTSLLPSGVYNLYTLVVPAGETDFSHYYFWATNFVIDH